MSSEREVAGASPMNRRTPIRHHKDKLVELLEPGMSSDGFTDEGLAALDAALARHTSTGAVPGLVALVARGGQVHVTSAGHNAIGDSALGSLPLIDQPGERFRYNTGAMVAGILIERVTGAPFAEVLSKRVFEPLGMTDTAFYVPPAKVGRFTSMYAPREAAAVFGGDAAGGDMVGENHGWGLTMSVPAAGADPVTAPLGVPRGYGWDGGSGTT
jgi:CubicO group peptidase (beta-lactamase class C family)